MGQPWGLLLIVMGPRRAVNIKNIISINIINVIDIIIIIHVIIIVSLPRLYYRA
jgi:hypothetical protein